LKNEVIIRRMTLQDLDAVVDIEQKTFPRPWTRENYQYEIEQNVAARYLVAENRGNVVGYAGAWIIIDESHITNIAVDPQHRGQGIGRLLITGLLQYLSNLGAAYSTLEVRESNETAIALYKSLGFICVGRRKKYYEDNREDALIMVCDSLPEADPEFTEPETIHEDN